MQCSAWNVKRVYGRKGRVSHPTPKLKVSSAFGRKRKRELEELSFLRVKGDSPHNKYATVFVFGTEDDIHLRRFEYKLAGDAANST